MLQWNELHPYSAVHVVRVQSALDAARLRLCVNHAVRKHGLTSLRLDRQRYAFQYDVAPAECELQCLTSPGDPLAALIAEIERQLNLEFASHAPFSPFRFLVLPEQNGFFFGLSYFHPAADAESVVHLLKDIVTGYQQGVPSGPGQPFDLYPNRRADRLCRRPLVVARKVVSLPAQIRNLRQSHRPPCRDADNLNNGFVCFALGPEQLETLIAVANSWSVTLNDIFMGLLLKSLAPCAIGREQERRRRKISIGCIVNLRKELGVDGPRVFGLFLGSFIVTHATPQGINLREISMDIRRQTARIKKHKLYLGTSLELALARSMLSLFSPRRRKKLYAKHYPLWGGITNMNLNSLWEETGPTGVIDYYRGVSTGPITPLALSVTTVGNRVNIGLSFRTAVFSREDISQVEHRFQEQVEQTCRAA